jgi:hypothetical protein
MSSQDQSPAWVERLFSRLQVRYADAWLRKWEGINLAAVKADWCEQLGPLFQRNPKAISYALDHLPPYPPNSDGFLRICLLAPSPMLALPPVTAQPNLPFLAEVVGRIRGASQAQQKLTPAEHCANRLREIRARKGSLLGAQADMLAKCEAMGKGWAEMGEAA